MSTQKQIQANRRNASKSTGPRTPEGKAKVSKNAITHGLTSECVLIPGEDAEELEAFREAMLEGLAPEGAVELWLAGQFIAGCWRLRRAGTLEREVVAAGLEEWHLLTKAEEEEIARPKAEMKDLTPARVMANTMQRTDTYSKICRYESHLQKGLYAARHELQRLQATRRGREVAPPAVVEVAVSGLPEVAETAALPPGPPQGKGTSEGKKQGKKKKVRRAGIGAQPRGALASGRRSGKTKAGGRLQVVFRQPRKVKKHRGSEQKGQGTSSGKREGDGQR